jgi:hypothetical protein
MNANCEPSGDCIIFPLEKGITPDRISPNACLTRDLKPRLLRGGRLPGNLPAPLDMAAQGC